MTKPHEQLFTGLLSSTKSTESNAVLVLLSAADTESHGCASVSWSHREVLNLVIPLWPIQGTPAMSQ
ncbi:MAG: hypothetical protein QF699_05900, partial [Candidatus Poseidoniaceae archaeon]|nr:hypothetical protein [Candidatus Poseidoniaceae archaeon]